ncbi:MAG: glycosyltransferase [Pirellulales bacterium]
MSATAGPLRLAFCITELETGGAEQCLVELATRLDRDRFQPVVYSLAGPPAEPRHLLVARLHEAEVAVNFLGARRPWDIGWLTRRLGRALAEQRCELIQTFLFHANLVGRLAARWGKVPRVISGIRVAERRRGWRLWADRLTSPLVDAHVCVSQSVAEFSRGPGGLPAERLVVIPNGVDIQRFEAAKPLDLTTLGLPSGRRAVTFVGRLDPQKGLDQLIAHARRWLDQVAGHDLLVVGAGPQRAELERVASRSGLDNRIHFAGWSSQVPEILAASDLLVLSSNWEGLPNAVLEAMASRLAVVATDVEGVRELLGPAADEQVVPAGRPEVLASRIMEILSNPPLRERLGRENQLRAGRHFSLEKMVEAYSELYQRLRNRDRRAGDS